MPGFLRQATASQSRAIGPFLDDTDFKTPETGLTIANTDIKLIVNGAASANKNSGGGTHRTNGVYGVTFDGTDTATVGEMEVSVVVAGALPVFDKFFVIEEAVYDAFYAASSPGYNAAQVVASVTGAVGSVTGNVGGSVASVTGAVGSVTGAVGSVTGNVGGNVTGSVGSVTGNVGGNVVGSVASVTGNVGGNVVGSVDSVVDPVTVGTNSDKTGYALSATGSAALTESYAADGATATIGQLLYMIWSFLAEKDIASTTLTAKKLDGSTSAMTFTLDSATTPTSITRAT